MLIDFEGGIKLNTQTSFLQFEWGRQSSLKDTINYFLRNMSSG
jgi:hypothetical protein